MEYTFVKPVNKKYGLVYDWCLKISDVITLFMYEEKIASSKFLKVFHEEIGRSKEEDQSDEAFIISLTQKENESFVESFANFFDRASQVRLRVMEECGTIYIQKTGSYFNHNDNIKIIAEKVMSDIVFPEGKEERYIKWPNGKHWYAKIGDLNVKWDGKNKWGTEEEAKEATKQFLMNLK